MVVCPHLEQGTGLWVCGLEWEDDPLVVKPNRVSSGDSLEGIAVFAVAKVF